MVISVIVVLEIIQLVVFLTSRWLKVNLLCFYVKSMAPDNHGSLSHFFAEVIGFIFLGSSRSSNSAWWRKPWKRDMSQYSLVESCTTLLKPISYLKQPFISIVSIGGLPFSKPGRKLSKAIKVSDEVKKAVVMFLQREETSPKLSNGAGSLSRNEVTLPAWASQLKNDTETILVWHIATSVCELQAANGDAESTNSDMKVAIELSKYCAYLLFFEPVLLPVPTLAAETICGTAIEEAIGFFNQQVFGCGGKVTDGDKYTKLISLCSKVDIDEEGGVKWISDESVLKKGAELGRILLNLVKDGKEMKWKILADFWTEMILYLAPSNNNELEHARKLSQGGEFITHLWTLLIHAGIHNRDEIDRAF